MSYLLHILIMINIYVVLVLSANLTIGMANLLTMCQAAFYGIGAYICAFFLLYYNLPFIVIASSVMLCSGLFSCLVSFASVKLKGEFFVIATMGFQLICYNLLNNWKTVTHGADGIFSIPNIKLLGRFELSSIYAYFALSLVVAVLVVFVHHCLVKSPFGRTLKAIRADETMVQALGRNTIAFKAWAFFISAALAGLAGVIYASLISYIDPTSFTLDESIFIISALFIGGIGNTKGPMLGAVFVVLLPQLLTFVGLPDALAANLRQIIYGLALILVMFFRPQGLWGKTILK